MELELHQVHTHGTQRVSFAALSDVMKASETATNIDDEATSCIGNTAMVGGIHCDPGNKLWLLVIFHGLLEIYGLKYRQQNSNPFDIRSRTARYSLHEKRMTFTIH
jgi:hypothetical protein